MSASHQCSDDKIQTMVDGLESADTSTFRQSTTFSEEEIIAIFAMYFKQKYTRYSDISRLTDVLFGFDFDDEVLAKILLMWQKMQIEHEAGRGVRLPTVDVLSILTNNGGKIHLLRQNPRQIKYILRSLAEEKDQPIRFFKIFFSLTVEGIVYIEFGIQIITQYVASGTDTAPITFSDDFTANDMLGLMSEQNITSSLKAEFARRSIGYRTNILGWFLQILDNFVPCSAVVTELNDYLPSVLSETITSYMEQNHLYSPQASYDQLMLEMHGDENCLIFAYLFYEPSATYEAEGRFSKLLCKISLDVLQKYLANSASIKFIIEMPTLFDHIHSYLQTIAAPSVTPTSVKSPVDWMTRSLTCNGLVHSLSMSLLPRIAEQSNGYNEFCVLLKNLKKHTLLTDIEQKAEITYTEADFKKNIVANQGDKNKLMVQTFLALFRTMDQDQFAYFLKNIKLRYITSVVFIAILKALKELSNPAIRGHALKIIFDELSSQQIASRLENIPAKEIYSLFEIDRIKNLKEQKTPLIKNLREYLKAQSGISHLRAIQAHRARIIIAYSDTEKIDDALFNVIQEAQANHDKNRYRLFATGSRLVKIVIDAKHALKPRSSPFVPFCAKICGLFKTANDRVYQLLAEEKPSIRQEAKRE